MMSNSIRERLFRALAQTILLVAAGLVLGALWGSQCGCGVSASPDCTAHHACTFEYRATSRYLPGICEVDADVAGASCYARCDVTAADPCGPGGATATDGDVCYCIDWEAP